MEEEVITEEAAPAAQPTKKRSRAVHNTLIVVLSFAIAIMLVLWVVIGYLLYVICSYSRLPDKMALEVTGSRTEALAEGGTYTIMTYNVGFGAYSPDYTFFMDTGIMKDGTKTVGKHGTAVSADAVKHNIEGAAGVITAFSPDFAIIQEVDYDSTRSYHIDERVTFNAIEGYCSVFANNYHSSFLMYPFNDPHGANNAGIMTLSKYKVADSTRYAFPIDEGFAKFTDLDRCFSITHIPVGTGGKYLAVISLHMSAYDEGGVIRKKQASLLKSVLEAEYESGNYVIAGGDFNQDLIGDLKKFKSDQDVPDWVSSYDTADIPACCRIVADNSSAIGSCRGADVEWKRDWTYTCVIDGFIVSENVEDLSVNILYSDTSGGRYADFEFSDHNPVLLQFKLK